VTFWMSLRSRWCEPILGERLWSKVLSDTPNGRLAQFGVNEKRFCIGFAGLLDPFAMASRQDSVDAIDLKLALYRRGRS
jgi:hypothetical protein